MTKAKRSTMFFLLSNIGLIYVWVTRAENPKSCLMTVESSYQTYRCVKTATGSLPLLACSLKCCREHRCIGIFHKKEQANDCYLIDASEEDENCPDMDWYVWTAYKKHKELGDCGSLLMDTVGYYELGDNTGVTAENSRLDYVPTAENETGGFLLSNDYLIVKLLSAATVRGIVTQGAWRNGTLGSCCDDRVTAFKINWAVDCDQSWTFYAADNAIEYEANVIPGAGNEAILNLFDEPVVGMCFVLYVQSYHQQPLIRWDLVGCEI